MRLYRTVSDLDMFAGKGKRWWEGVYRHPNNMCEYRVCLKPFHLPVLWYDRLKGWLMQTMYFMGFLDYASYECVDYGWLGFPAARYFHWPKTTCYARNRRIHNHAYELGVIEGERRAHARLGYEYEKQFGRKLWGV